MGEQIEERVSRAALYRDLPRDRSAWDGRRSFCNQWPTQQRTSAKSMKEKSCTPVAIIAKKGGRRRSQLSPNTKNFKLRAVIDTLVASISGFRDQYIADRNPRADVLHRWEEKNNLIRLLTEDILDDTQVLKRLHDRSNQIGRIINVIRERAEPATLRSAPPKISPDPKGARFLSAPIKSNRTFLSP